MKKLFALFALFALASCALAQSTSPRFGVLKNQDNTGRGLTYGYLAPTITATTVIAPNKFDNTYAIPSLTLSPIINFTVTSANAADRTVLIIGASAATRTVTFGGSVVTSATTMTVGSGKKATASFIFDGANYIEVSRTVQP